MKADLTIKEAKGIFEQRIRRKSPVIITLLEIIFTVSAIFVLVFLLLNNPSINDYLINGQNVTVSENVYSFQLDKDSNYYYQDTDTITDPNSVIIDTTSKVPNSVRISVVTVFFISGILLSIYALSGYSQREQRREELWIQAIKSDELPPAEEL